MTNAIPEQPNAGNGSQPQSFADPALAQQPSSVFDMSQYFDADIEGVEGMNARAPGGTSLAMVDDTMRTGNPSGLERMIFTALGDGSPALAFYDDMGQAQVMRVTENQWLTMLNQRDDNRRELQYRMDAEQRKEDMRLGFTNYLRDANLTDAQRAHAHMLYDQGHTSGAIDMVGRVAQFNATQEAEYRMMGGESALGPDAWPELQSMLSDLGEVMPSHMNKREWHAFYDRVIPRWLESKNQKYNVGGRNVSPDEALMHAHASNVRQHAAVTEGGVMVQTAGDQTHLTSRLQDSLAGSARDFPNLARGPELMSLPPMSLADYASQTNQSSGVSATIASAVYLQGMMRDIQKFQWNENGKIDPFSDENIAATNALIDASNRIAVGLGWEPILPPPTEGPVEGAGGYTEAQQKFIHGLVDRAQEIEDVSAVQTDDLGPTQSLNFPTRDEMNRRYTEAEAARKAWEVQQQRDDATHKAGLDQQEVVLRQLLAVLMDANALPEDRDQAIAIANQYLGGSQVTSTGSSAPVLPPPTSQEWSPYGRHHRGGQPPRATINPDVLPGISNEVKIEVMDALRGLEPPMTEIEIANAASGVLKGMNPGGLRDAIKDSLSDEAKRQLVAAEQALLDEN